MKSDDHGVLIWAITSLLLTIVLLVFSFGGTIGEFASLLGRVAALGCSLLALRLFVVYLRHDRGGHSGASR